MPTSGGTAGKLGDTYEVLWAVDQVLSIIDGSAQSIVYESLDSEESRGIEFRVHKADNTVEYWSVKRQTTKAAGWTLAVLTKKDDRGRAILGDLLEHVERSPSHRAVFASALGARDFDELRMHAQSREMLEGRLERSADLKQDFTAYLLPVCGGNAERARVFLSRTRTHAADEAQLRERVHFEIRNLLCPTDGSIMNVGDVRRYLAELLLDNMHQMLDQPAILKKLAEKGIGRRDWALEKTVTNRVDAICEAYTAPLQAQLINGAFLPLFAPGSILEADGKPVSSKVLVVGGAGGGKSTTLGAAVQQMRGEGIPVLPIRFDQLPEGILTTTELGRKMLLPESPTVVVAGLAGGGPCAIVVDQLDAVSVASGRRVELWSLFEAIRREAARIPQMSLIVGCRQFDLEHDHRMRELKQEVAGFTITELKGLTPQQVDLALGAAGIDPAGAQPALKPALTVPLHLSMYLSLSSGERAAIRGRDELFDAFWVEKERRTDQRLGRKAAWTQVIDRLSDWLSANQQLSAPAHVLDEFSVDAAAMASEHVLVFVDGRYRLFHESFFDYAFARRFAATGGRLERLLLGSEQHLFRRAQVRQVLAYLRACEWGRYLRDLEDVLGNTHVRFHIKRLVFTWLSSLPDPRREEWEVLQRLTNSDPGLRSHIRTVVSGHAGWFDVLEGIGFFDEALSSDDATRVEEVIVIFGRADMLQTRSDHVARLLRKHRRPGEAWDKYLRYVCLSGEIYHGREMFGLFLSLIDDGTLDGFRPHFALNDDWWTVLYSVAAKRPEFACEAIGRWFDRALALSHDLQHGKRSPEQNDISELDLRQHLDKSGNGSHVIFDAAKSAGSYVEHMLPRIARVVNSTAKSCRDQLDTDPLWSSRSYGDRAYSVHVALFVALANALEALAKMARSELDRWIGPYLDRQHDAIAYLVLRAWTSAPANYADRLADYLAADTRRLKVGYAGNGGGSAAIHTSSQAVKAASAICSPEKFSVLERAILSLRDHWEAKHPQQRGLKQLGLLESLHPSRLSATGRAKLDELRAKFPAFEHGEPKGIGMGFVGSPITAEAQKKMSDAQWLRALRKYAGVEHRRDREGGRSGGEWQLAQSLEAKTKTDPLRFAALANHMLDDSPSSYFAAIMHGVADAAARDEGGTPAIGIEAIVALIRRVHSLPARPCGRDIAWLIEKLPNRDWPDDVIDAVAWYAINDRDPDDRQACDGGDPHHAGNISARGAIAGAVARLIFDRPERFLRLRDAVFHLAHDRSIAVRSCAVEALLAVWNVDRATAISWFKDCVDADVALLKTPYVERFIHYSGRPDYAAIRSVVQKMLGSSERKTVEAAARQVCLLALDTEAANDDAERVRTGAEVMRKAAADVYATKVAHEVVGCECRRLLKPFFADPDDSVRAEAASAFRQIADLTTSDQADLLRAFLDATPSRAALEPVVRAIEDSPVQLPDLVCSLAEVCVEACKADAGDISRGSAMVASDLSKIVVRLYAQTEDTAIQSRCLDLIDKMERHHFWGLGDELRRLDR